MTRFCLHAALRFAIVLALALPQSGKAQQQTSWSIDKTASPRAADAADRSYRIYSLNELGGDPSLGEWLAQTIPDVIAPGTWKGPGVIRYYAPKNILVVCHTAAIQAKVDGFLKDVTKTLPGAKAGHAATAKSAAPSRNVVPATYHAPASLTTSRPMAEPTLSYPVPAQTKAPKHLFHFIIRYEGEGIIDDSVVKVMKSYMQAEKKRSETPTVSAPPGMAYGTTGSMSVPTTLPGTTAAIPYDAPATLVPPASVPSSSAQGVPAAPIAPTTTPKEKGQKKAEKTASDKKPEKPPQP